MEKVRQFIIQNSQCTIKEEISFNQTNFLLSIQLLAFFTLVEPLYNWELTIDNGELSILLFYKRSSKFISCQSGAVTFIEKSI